MSEHILPNIRKLIIPDSGYTLFDADLAGADAQVVAWEAGDEQLKEAFRKGLKVHMVNCRTIFPHKVKGWTDDAIKATDHPGGIYYACKRGVHATNYGAKPPTVATACGWPRAEAEDFQRRWFGEHPAIRQWHLRTDRALRETGTITNAFGFRRTYLERPDGILPEALAWPCQSTVARVTFKALLAMRKLPHVRILLQVHDANIFQIPTPFVQEVLPLVTAACDIVVPFSDPLRISWGLSSSTRSWGDCAKCAWPERAAA